MAARITYSVTTPWGGQVAELASQVVHTQQLCARIVAACNSMSGGGAGPWTQLETELGMAPGTGAALYAVLNNARSILNTVTGIDTIDMGQ
jgi:hypothetical protein